MDRRVKKSRQAIKVAFLEMLLTSGFESITIKELTEKADISRKTFYLHFADKYQLLDALVTEHIEQLTDTCRAYPENNLIESSIIWFQYFEQNKPFFAALFKNESTVSFRKALLNYLMTEIGGEIKTDNREITVRFLSNAVIGIVESFISDELSSNCEFIAKQVGILLERNLYLE